MSFLLLIETSSTICSVAVTGNGKVLAVKESESDRNHAAAITLYIQEVIARSEISLKDIDAVAVNGGPGSYTGLRIGLSTAKGLCYSLEKPLLIIDAMQSLCAAVLEEDKESIESDKKICTVIDNRRDEIFYSLFTAKGKPVKPVTLSFTHDAEFVEIINSNKIIFAGAANSKLQQLAQGNNMYVPVTLSAKYLLKAAEESYRNKNFADLAYSEPLYYKGVYISGN